jgi:uncharacterized protein (UPF0335 family)
MAKKEKPADPLLSAVAASEGKSLPAFSPQPATGEPPPNFNSAAAKLVSGIKRLQHLEAEIALLNAGKTSVYAELKAMGFKTKTVRKTLANLRIDPLVRQEQAEVEDLYMRAYESMADVVDDETYDEAAPA